MAPRSRYDAWDQHLPDDDLPDDDLPDDDLPDDEDTDLDEDAEDLDELDAAYDGTRDPTIDCPNCGAEIYDDAEWCPACDQYVSREDAPRSTGPWWVTLGFLACLAVVLIWIFLV